MVGTFQIYEVQKAALFLLHPTLCVWVPSHLHVLSAVEIGNTIRHLLLQGSLFACHLFNGWRLSVSNGLGDTCFWTRVYIIKKPHFLLLVGRVAKTSRQRLRTEAASWNAIFFKKRSLKSLDGKEAFGKWMLVLVSVGFCGFLPTPTKDRKNIIVCLKWRRKTSN